LVGGVDGLELLGRTAHGGVGALAVLPDGRAQSVSTGGPQHRYVCLGGLADNPDVVDVRGANLVCFKRVQWPR